MPKAGQAGNGTKPHVSGSADTPAIPPEDYKGSVGDWMIALIERDLWDGEGWHGDVMLTSEQWWEILEQCEGED